MIYHIRVVDILSPDLALRANARRLFELVESRAEDEVVLDFAGVETIGRSFAHEYVVRRDSSRKRVTEVNVPENVRRMLDIVKVAKTTRERWLPPPEQVNRLVLTL